MDFAARITRHPLAADPDRATRFSTEADGLTLDWSKTLIDETARDLLLELAQQVPARDLAGIEQAAAALRCLVKNELRSC